MFSVARRSELRVCRTRYAAALPLGGSAGAYDVKRQAAAVKGEPGWRCEEARGSPRLRRGWRRALPTGGEMASAAAPYTAKSVLPKSVQRQVDENQR